jgi:hypothetical protein
LPDYNNRPKLDLSCYGNTDAIDSFRDLLPREAANFGSFQDIAEAKEYLQQRGFYLIDLP